VLCRDFKAELSDIVFVLEKQHNALPKEKRCVIVTYNE